LRATDVDVEVDVEVDVDDVEDAWLAVPWSAWCADAGTALASERPSATDTISTSGENLDTDTPIPSEAAPVAIPVD
jgi:hypothetical protein